MWDTFMLGDWKDDIIGNIAITPVHSPQNLFDFGSPLNRALNSPVFIRETDTQRIDSRNSVSPRSNISNHTVGAVSCYLDGLLKFY